MGRRNEQPSWRVKPLETLDAWLKNVPREFKIQSLNLLETCMAYAAVTHTMRWETSGREVDACSRAATAGQLRGPH